MRKCTIIGITDNRSLWYREEMREVLATNHCFSGGKRHYEIVKDALPDGHKWIYITVPLSAVFAQYAEEDEVVVFASGDPLFYGFASTVMRKCSDCEVKVLPAFNSIQQLAHCLLMPYNDLVTVSLTGRPWDKLDEALIKGDTLIGCLTDHHKTPHEIWNRLTSYGYTNYRMWVGEKMGNEEEERVREYSEKETYANPNCVILQQKEKRFVPFGLPDEAFHLLDGRKKMITKMPVRLCTLSALDLGRRQHFWDVGFCTGSISIEAKLRFPHLHITAFEVRPEGEELMDKNSRKFGTPGIETIIGDFMEEDLNQRPQPDAVFVGGHNGRLKEMVMKIKEHLAPGGVIVFNSVSEESMRLFKEGAAEAGMRYTLCHELTADQHNPIKIMKAE